MNRFELTVEFSSPLVLTKGTFWTLDAVCHGILWDMRELGLVDVDPIEAVPLHSEDGLFFASQAKFHGHIAGELAKIGGIRPVKDMMDAEGFLLNKRRRFPKVVTTRGRFKANMSRMTEVSLRSASWVAQGDPEAVKALIVNAGSIGGLRKDGYGTVADVSYEVDNSINPIVEDGRPRRPIPIGHVAAGAVSSSALRMPTTWRPFYFDMENIATCAVPGPPEDAFV